MKHRKTLSNYVSEKDSRGCETALTCETRLSGRGLMQKDRKKRQYKTPAKCNEPQSEHTT
jgi:hypothetical protein